METEYPDLERLLQMASESGLIERYEVAGDLVTLHLEGLSMTLRSVYAEDLLRKLLQSQPPPRGAPWRA